MVSRRSVTPKTPKDKPSTPNQPTDDGFKPNFVIEGTAPTLPPSEVQGLNKKAPRALDGNGQVIDAQTVEISDEENTTDNVLKLYPPGNAEDEEKKKMDLEDRIAPEIFQDVALHTEKYGVDYFVQYERDPEQARAEHERQRYASEPHHNMDPGMAYGLNQATRVPPNYGVMMNAAS